MCSSDLFPFLASKFPFVKSESTARAVEPVLCVLIGSLLCMVSETLGLFVMSMSLSLMIVRAVEIEASNAQLRRMRDAKIEQEFLSERFRE